MITLPPIGRDTLLHVISEVRRLRAFAILQSLEATNPDLVEHVLEELLTIDQLLTDTRITNKKKKRVLRHARNLAVVMLLVGRHRPLPLPSLN